MRIQRFNEGKSPRKKLVGITDPNMIQWIEDLIVPIQDIGIECSFNPLDETISFQKVTNDIEKDENLNRLNIVSEFFGELPHVMTELRKHYDASLWYFTDGEITIQLYKKEV